MSVIRSTCQEWVVLLEAADEDGDGIDRATFSRLVDSWTAARPTTLYSPTRYALQVTVRAPSPAAALSAALLRWKDALRHTGIPEWTLVRAELVTPQELEREIVAGELEGPVTDRPSVAAGDDLLRRALYDDLTGLPNRELFLDGVRAVLTAGAPHGIIVLHVAGSLPGAVPLDRDGGDQVLVEAAARMAATVRSTDSVARVGDHQLAALIGGRTAEQIAVVAARILDRVSGTVPSAGGPVLITASLGTAMAPPGADADVVFLHAEHAMWAATGSDSTRRSNEPMR